MAEQFYSRTRKAQIQTGLIEVGVALNPAIEGLAGENLLAYPIGGNYAQIASIPFFATHVGLDDIVETEISGAHQRAFVEIVKKNTNTAYMEFAINSDDRPVKSNLLVAYLTKHNIRYEVFSESEGIYVAALPTYLDPMWIKDFWENAPMVLSVHVD